MMDLSNLVKQLQAVSDEELRAELHKHRISMPDERLDFAFASYGITRWLAGIPVAVLREGAPPIPDRELDAVRWKAVFVFRVYTALVYMQNEYLKQLLDNVPEDSPLLPFQHLFGSGSQEQGEDSLAQHLRNSLCRGTFNVSPDLQTAFFYDGGWEAKVAMPDLMDGLCEEAFRFYTVAYQPDANTREA